LVTVIDEGTGIKLLHSATLPNFCQHLTLVRNKMTHNLIPQCKRLAQGFPTWGTCTQTVYLLIRRAHLRLSIEEQNIFAYDLFPNIYTYISEYSFQKSLYAYC